MTNQEQYELLCKKAEEYDRLTKIKNKLEQLDHKKKFIEIINTGTESKPYYEIKYLDTVTNVVHIGYSSYRLDVISEYLRSEFDNGYTKGYTEALEQNDVLDKIRAEIKALSPEPTAYDVVDGNPIKDAVWETLADVLQIIDKYRAEREG